MPRSSTSGSASDAVRRVLLGHIIGAHGVRGGVLLRSYAAEPADIAAYGELESEDGTRRFRVQVTGSTSKGLIATIDGVRDRNGAEALRGTALYVPRAALPETAEGEFYFEDLVGLAVVDAASGGPIGRVASVANYGAGDILEIAREAGGASELVPFAAPYIVAVDVGAGTVRVTLPATASDDEGAD